MPWQYIATVGHLSLISITPVPIRSGAPVEYMNCNLLNIFFQNLIRSKAENMLVFNGKEPLKILYRKTK